MDLAFEKRGANMRLKRVGKLVVVLILFFTLRLAIVAADTTNDDKKREIHKMAEDTLQRLYKADPKAKSALEKAAGYAVFSNLGIKILLAGSGNGRGVAVNNRTKAEIFMENA